MNKYPLRYLPALLVLASFASAVGGMIDPVVGGTVGIIATFLAAVVAYRDNQLHKRLAAEQKSAEEAIAQIPSTAEETSAAISGQGELATKNFPDLWKPLEDRYGLTPTR